MRNCTWHSYIQIKSTANIGESFDSFFCIFASAGFGRAWPLLRFLTAAAAGFSFALRCFCVGDEAGGGGCFFFEAATSGFAEVALFLRNFVRVRPLVGTMVPEE